jgi:4-alpha-glucanotransferase
MSLFTRSSGILLHPTSLPGRYGIGDLGESAYRFVDWLADNDQGVWQVLPLGPTSYGDSPYQTLSAFAGNPNLISLDRLVEHGWLRAEDLADVPDFPADYVDFGPVIDYHDVKLHLAYQRFADEATRAPPKPFEDRCAQKHHLAGRFTRCSSRSSGSTRARLGGVAGAARASAIGTRLAQAETS